MPKTDAGDRRGTDLLDSPEALRSLAGKAKRFAASLPHELMRQRIIDSAVRLEAEAVLLEQLREGQLRQVGEPPGPPQPNIATATSTSSSRRTGLAR